MKTILPKNHWHKREFAIYGTTCESVAHLFEKIQNASLQNLVFVDASHQQSEERSDNLTAHRDGFELFQQHPINSTTLIHFSGAVINGNHHKASAQVIVVNELKKESLIKREDQLTNVVAVVHSAEEAIPHHIQKFITANTQVLTESEFLNGFIRNYFSTPDLNLLILAGGESKRMGEDKALLKYKNEVQLERLVRLSHQLKLNPFLSVRQNQMSWGELFGIETIEDVLIQAGPVGGIISAMKKRPGEAWLVVACDLPLLDYDHLTSLIQKRNSKKIATCFESPLDGGPEPLATIYEPHAIYALTSWWALGYHCPRKMLFNSNVELIKPNNHSILMNVNTPDERNLANSKL
jgi:molybdopterin-guanine dinucleotide biosynthesis protein A